MSIFKGRNITLRALEPEDLDQLYLWENETDIWDLGSTLKPYSRDVLRKYLQTAHHDIFESKQVRFGIHKNGSPSALIGLIDLYEYDPQHQRAGVGILIGDHAHRKLGYGSEALKILCRYAFSFLQLHQLFCAIPSDNQGSIKLFTKTGFTKTGERPDWIKTEFGWKTEYFYQLLADEWSSRS